MSTSSVVLETFDDDGSANTQFCDFGIVGQSICFKNDLDVFEERTVVQFDKISVSPKKKLKSIKPLQIRNAGVSPRRCAGVS